MEDWRKPLKFDPLPQLEASESEALTYFVRRDLLGEEVGPVEALWQLPKVAKILKRQQEDGSWKYPRVMKGHRSRRDSNQAQTYKIVMEMVEKYGFTRDHAAIRSASSFLFTFQTGEGDFRGIYRDQYTPNYSAGIMELMVKAGYQNDQRIEKGFAWLLSVRQDDGGWAVPLRTLVGKGSTRDAFHSPEPIQPDRSKPFSHWCTGVVLRAFAAHEEYRRAPEARLAGELLKSRFFQRDKYPDRQAKSYWMKIRYPFFWTGILSALDSLSWLGFSKDDPDIKRGLGWLVTNQEETGLWKAGYLKAGDKDIHLWTSLGVCRVFKRYYG